MSSIRTSSKKKPTVAKKRAISLFSGAGGDTYGLEQAGYTVTHYSEFNKTAIMTHQAAFPHSTLLTAPDGTTNIQQIPDDVFTPLQHQVDLIMAGFPCQAMSHAGKKRADDPRNQLVFEFVRVARLVQPTWIIGENVKGLLSRKWIYPENTSPRPVINIITEIFEEIGYKITYHLFDATEVNVPQRRKRLLIVGHRGELYPHLPPIPVPATLPIIRSLLSTTLDGAVPLPMLYRPDEHMRFLIRTTETETSGTPHPNLIRLVTGIRNRSSKEKSADNEKSIIEPNGLISFGVRKSGYHGEILDPDAPSKTILCAYNQCPRLFVGLYSENEKGEHQYWIRCLTVVESAQIQGFPADYPWRGQPKDHRTQIGNAVPPPLATTIATLLPQITFHDTPQKKDMTQDVNDDEE